MAMLVLSNLESMPLNRKVMTLGQGTGFDSQIPSQEDGLIFTLIQQGAGFQCLPGDQKLVLNGQNLSRACTLKSCDRLEWGGGAAVYLENSVKSLSDTLDEEQRESPVLQVLQRVMTLMLDESSVAQALRELLDALMQISGAQAGYLLTEIESSRGWDLICGRERVEDKKVRDWAAPPKKEWISNTVLNQAIKSRQVLHIENIVGHPFASADSVIAARIFSVACIPLIMGGRVLGAVFLYTRTPGSSIKKASLPALQVLSTQVALMLASGHELRKLQQQSPSAQSPAFLYSESSPMASVARMIDKSARAPLPTLILGETGSGKEVIAREIHRRSPQSSGPFVAVNCAAIPASLLESTLFGHEKGAFTGADQRQPGKFQLAEGGTLLLDEIGDLPLELQTRLLRVLQEKEVEPLGARKPVPIRVRVLAATHRDLEDMQKRGEFRQDLYFRLNGMSIQLAPLRERPMDIAMLAEHFLSQCGLGLSFTQEALDFMEQLDWPGNIRQLQHLVQRTAFLAEGNQITLGDLKHQTLEQTSTKGTNDKDWSSLSFDDLRQAQNRFTQDLVRRTLSLTNGDRSKAAGRLGISERTLYRILSTDSFGSFH